MLHIESDPAGSQSDHEGRDPSRYPGYQEPVLAELEHQTVQ